MPLGTFLNGREPVRLRGLAFSALSDTAVVQSRTFVSDAGGGGSATWVAAGTVACRVDPVGGDAGDVVGSRVDERSTHEIRVPIGVEITTDRRIAVEGRGVFEVTAVRERTGEQIRVFEAVEVS